MKRASRLAVFSLSLCFLLAPAQVLAQDQVLPERTGLDDYVERADDSFKWEVVGKVEETGATTFVVDMTSQTWRTKEEVDRTAWQHWVVVTVPDEVASDTAFLLIDGGSNGGEPPKGADSLSAQVARGSKSVVVDLKMIPNQSLEFFGDGKRRSEDDLIAYTWVKFMETGDATWPARMPMVKSAVRAMDMVQELLASDEGGNHEIKQFVVAGGSKRGWTTWLTGAVDPRVRAIIPVVIDVLNVRESMLHHFAAYGFWSPAVGDYVRHEVTKAFYAPEYADLLKLVDPFHYRHRLTMPKYVVNAGGDEFFLPDSSQFYWDDLEGEKYLRYVPNASHSLAGSDAPQSILAYYHAILTDTPRPKFSWTMGDDGSIRVETADKPLRVNLWQATNPKARDFRLQTIGKAYVSTELTEEESGVYVAHVDQPAEGFTAFFVEMVYPSGLPIIPFKFTTAVRVLPDVLPFEKEAEVLATGGGK